MYTYIVYTVTLHEHSPSKALQSTKINRRRVKLKYIKDGP